MTLLQMITSEQFALLREHFLRVGFTEEAIRQRLDIPAGKELDLAGLSGRPPVKPKVGDGLDALIYLFVVGESLPAAALASQFPSAVWEALQLTGLIVPDPADANRSIA